MAILQIGRVGSPVEGKELCDVCGWEPAPHACAVVRMTEAEEAEVIAALDGATAAGPLGLKWWWSGDVTLALPNGWTVVVFSDCGAWDYLDEVRAPDGRVWEYPHRPDSGRAMTQRVADWCPADMSTWLLNYEHADEFGICQPLD